MTERDWQKDWEMCQRAIPGPWRWVYYKWTDIYALVGPRDETILDDGSYRGEYDSPGERLITPDDPTGQFIAEAREALPHWLQRARELEATLVEVWCLCNQRVPRNTKLLRELKYLINRVLDREEVE